VQIHFKSHADCDVFYFCDLAGPMKIQLPSNVAVPDLLLLIQGSLDQLRPVLMLSDPALLLDLNLGQLKSHHFHIEKNKFVFLNYSIRNSLSHFDSSLALAMSFDEIHAYFERNLQK